MWVDNSGPVDRDFKKSPWAARNRLSLSNLQGSGGHSSGQSERGYDAGFHASPAQRGYGESEGREGERAASCQVEDVGWETTPDAGGGTAAPSLETAESDSTAGVAPRRDSTLAFDTTPQVVPRQPAVPVEEEEEEEGEGRWGWGSGDAPMGEAWVPESVGGIDGESGESVGGVERGFGSGAAATATTGCDELMSSAPQVMERGAGEGVVETEEEEEGQSGSGDGASATSSAHPLAVGSTRTHDTSMPAAASEGESGEPAAGVFVVSRLV